MIKNPKETKFSLQFGTCRQIVVGIYAENHEKKAINLSEKRSRFANDICTGHDKHIWCLTQTNIRLFISYVKFNELKRKPIHM